MARAPAPPERAPGPGRFAGLQVLARGANRLCVRDPDDPRYCLKFELPPAERTPATPRERLRRWVGRRLPRFGDNATELRAWRGLVHRHGDAVRERFAACHGLVDTPWGRALRCDCVVLADGSAAPSLHRLLQGDARHPADALCAAVDAFEAFLQARGIPLFDLNAGNFVVVPGDGGPRLVCVDAKSTIAAKEPLPVSRWIPALRRRKVARRAGRLRQRIRDLVT